MNDEKVKETIAKYRELQEICAEAAGMTQSKEIQVMMIQEKLARLDWNTSMAKSRAEGKAEGIAEGKAEGIKIALEVLQLKRDGKSDPNIVVLLMKNYNQSEAEAKEIFRQLSE